MLKVLASLAAVALAPLAAAASGGAAGGVASTTDPTSQWIIGAIIVGVFTMLALERVHRVLVVMGAVGLIWGITYFTPYKLISFEAVTAAVDANVLFLLGSMMAMVGVLKTTGVFEWAVAKMMNRSGGDPIHVMYTMVWFTGILSAICDNVTTVIFVTPMAFQMARAMGLRPMALLLPIIMASNIGGTATLIGDPPNIMIGSGAPLPFLEFIQNVTAPVIVMMFVLPWFSARFFRKDYEAVQRSGRATGEMAVPAIVDPRLLRWALWISAFVFVGFFTHSFTGMPTAIPATIGAAALLIVQDVLYLRTHKPTHEERQHGLLAVLEKEIEWPTLTFFAFLFIAVGAAVSTGLIDTMAKALIQVVQGGSTFFGLDGLGTLLFAALLICWVSGVLSAIIDNIPFVAVMIPIIHRLIGEMPGDPTVLWWALALGACLGGNGSPVGASANVTAIGLMDKAGDRMKFFDFVRFGAPTAAITLAISSVFLATHVYLGERGAATTWFGAVVVILAAQGAKRLVQRTPLRAATQ
ncbi:MAG TPA: ArsB/NhaD family transporter [Gemmatimonadaceae bacterium]|nr:ArsB/NhaD family transporter [Gemmatimonadaceae bacterium]